MTDRVALLERLLADPRRAAELAPGQAAVLLLELTCVQSALAARMLAPTSTPGAERHGVNDSDMLTALEAAQRTGMSRRWLYAHANTLPFACRISPRAVRFSARGIDRWLAARRA